MDFTSTANGTKYNIEFITCKKNTYNICVRVPVPQTIRGQNYKRTACKDPGAHK